MPEADREAAEIRFKGAQQAYEILYDDQKRQLYDTQGMAAFDGSRPGPGDGPDISELFAEMMFGGGAARGKRSGKSPDEEQKYEVSLEDLYKGKTVKFSSTKQVICGQCKGSGGKEKAKPKDCSVCSGQGTIMQISMYQPDAKTFHRVKNRPPTSGINAHANHGSMLQLQRGRAHL